MAFFIKQICMPQLVHINQYGFIKGRIIQDCLAWAFEYFHLCHSSKKKELIVMKLNFEKAFDKLEHEIIIQVLKHKGFGQKWISWVQNFYFYILKREGKLHDDDIHVTLWFPAVRSFPKVYALFSFQSFDPFPTDTRSLLGWPTMLPDQSLDAAARSPLRPSLLKRRREAHVAARSPHPRPWTRRHLAARHRLANVHATT
jgi:hypothetical protein